MATKAKGPAKPVVEVERPAKPVASTQVAVLPANLPAALREQLAAETAAMGSRIQAGGGDFIKLTKDKHFKLPDGTKHPGPLEVVVLDFVSANNFFDRPYKEGEITPPACFAIGLEPSSLVPSKNSPDRQADACNTCPNNEWGSKGEGKACTNNRILAIVAGIGDDGADPDAPLYLIKVSPTATKAWDSYVATIRAQYNAPPVAVVTDIFFDPSSEFQSLRFGNPRPNENLEMHFARKAAARQRLLQEPDVSGYKKVEVKKGRR